MIDNTDIFLVYIFSGFLWLLQSFKNKWAHRMANIIIAFVVIGALVAGAYLYISNLQEMDGLVASIIGMTMLVFYGLFGLVCWTIYEEKHRISGESE